MNIGWYARRLSRMSPSEVAHRGRDQLVKLLWRRLRGGTGMPDPTIPRPGGFATPLPVGAAATVPASARASLIAAADLLLESRWKVFGRIRTDLGPDPDWFIDISSGRRAPERTYALGIDLRDAASLGQVKYPWELARHQHLTVLAAAYHLTGDERYAQRVREHLQSWWSRNPFLTGIHWASGIEIGLRLLSWVWLRRLLDGWRLAPAVFEENPVFVRQVYDHQRYLATLPSHHSSANNHLLAEQAGLFASCCAFPYFPNSESRRLAAADTLRREMAVQTFSCGHNRELATDYHLFVLELLLTAAVEGEAAGSGLGPDSWRSIASMMDALAAMLDVRLRPPRQGDSDDGHGILLDAPHYDRIASLLATGRSLIGGQPWWPPVDAVDIRTAFWSSMAARRLVARPETSQRPDLLPEAGLAFLRADDGTASEIWCRCDHGPLGFLSTAAHGHADALALEVRAGGVDILTDPGTYCYQGTAEWRRYFRSTRGHNTLELGGVNQSVEGGTFMWTHHAKCRLVSVMGLGEGELAVWEAEHDGYSRLNPPAHHRRRVELDRRARSLIITDTVRCLGEHHGILSWHLGPSVGCRLIGARAELRWRDGMTLKSAVLELPATLAWHQARGREHPPSGWYSPSFDVKVPTTTLIGAGTFGSGRSTRTSLTFCDGSSKGPSELWQGEDSWT